jgi:hypothetical protein
MNKTNNDMEKLTWLRDGCNWLVTITSGIIVASATFYTNIVGAYPSKIWIILLGWSFLLLSLVSGVVCYFSAFKKVVRKEYELKTISWVGCSYTIMLFTFLLGMMSLGIFIIYNKL